MFYLNGIELGDPSLGLFQNYGRKFLPKLLYIWLKRIVGWGLVDDDGGGAWETFSLTGGSNGSTDASNPELFNASGGNFDTLSLAAPRKQYIAITGFTGDNATRNGLYRIFEIKSSTQIRIRKEFCGMHSDGFPLSVSGLTWRVYDLGTYVNYDSYWAVLAGTGVGGTFHTRIRYASGDTALQTSPYDDWDASANDWKTPARYTAETPAINSQNNASVQVWGVADLTHAIIWYRILDANGAASELPSIIYIGDIVPFRPAADTSPVVQFHARVADTWVFPTTDGSKNYVNMLNGSNGQVSGKFLWPSNYAADGTQVLQGVRKFNSYYSGKLYRVPFLVVNSDNTYNEIRGYLKSLEMTHYYSITPTHTPFGASLDRLKLGNVCLPWFGSKQYRPITIA